MESNYQELRYNLECRDRNIMELEGQLLRVDYQYGLIIKDLKQKYRHIANQFNNNAIIIKQLKKQNKKLQNALNSQSMENQHLLNQINEANNKIIYQTQSINRLKQENQELRTQIKYMEANQNKYQLKAQENGKKKQQYKQQFMKMQEKVQMLEKQLKKMSFKNKQLQQLVQHEVLQTQNRIKNINFQIITKNTFQQTQQLVDKNCQTYTNSNSQTILKNNSQQLTNDWESDMKKLKNCIDYGTSYIIIFDAMNLDRIASRQIFKFLKKCLKQKGDAQTELQNLKQKNKKVVEQLKKKLIIFQQEIGRIKQAKNKIITIDTQIQTQNKNNISTQKTIIQLSELNTKLKIRMSTLIQCIQILALRSVVLGHQLKNSHTNTWYYKKTARKQSRSYHLTPVNRLRKVFYSVLFVQFLRKKRQQRVKLVSQWDKLGENNQKLQIQTMKLEKQGIKNVQIQKLKQMTIADRKQLHIRTSQIVCYYQFKLKNKLKQQQTSRCQIISI